MKVNGRDCGLRLRLGSRILGLPYSTDTLREEPTLVRREATIGEERGRIVRAGTRTTGCVVTPLSRSIAPALLAFAFGQEEPPDWESGTRSLYRHRLRQRYRDDLAEAEAVQERQASARRLPALRCAGWELRGSAGEPLRLKLELRGEAPAEEAGAYLRAPVAQEELYRFDQATLALDGERTEGFYAFSLSVAKSGGVRGAQLRLHVALDTRNERVFSASAVARAALDFPLIDYRYEGNRPCRFSIEAEDLVLAEDKSIVDSPDEVIGPLGYAINGRLSAEVYSADGERLLP